MLAALRHIVNWIPRESVEVVECKPNHSQHRDVHPNVGKVEEVILHGCQLADLSNTRRNGVGYTGIPWLAIAVATNGLANAPRP